MADDWEDWEADNFQPALPAVKKPEYETVGQALLASTVEVDQSKFAGEDEEEEEKPAPKPPKPEAPKSKQQKPKQQLREIDIPLDDPVAEKLRQQRLVEESDYAAAKELFGEVDDRRLEDLLPNSLKDFEEYAALLVSKYVSIHGSSKHFKGYLKSLFKAAIAPLPSTEIKDLETSLAGARAEKLKVEQAEKAKKGGKKTVNVGRAGGSAGLDDYIYDEALDDDGYDFM